MSSLSYCKGLPTPANELNALGFTQLEMFLSAFAPIFHQATCETVNRLLDSSEFDKSAWNTHLQVSYGISKRHANGIISLAKGQVDSASQCRANHIKTLQGKLKSLKKWIDKAEKKLKNARKFYRKKNWHNRKSGCVFPLSCSLEYHNTNWQNLRFQLHNKKRRCYQYLKQIAHRRSASIRVTVPRNQVFLVGSKDEKHGNQVCQWDGNVLNFRVPACLEHQFGKYVQSAIGNFDRKINRLPEVGAKTWHYYRKNGKWCICVQFTPSTVKPISRNVNYGCIGIDMNPGSIGWTYVDIDGNLKAHGKLPLQMGLPKGKQEAQIVDACLQLTTLASTLKSPVVCEELDFSAKKEQLRECGRKYARMLSGWAYSKFYEKLQSILFNRGIELITVNPAYSSVIGLVKYTRMYGLASDEAAAMVVARRAMQLSERLPALFRSLPPKQEAGRRPSAIQAYLSVNDSKHSWHWWNKLNNLLQKSGVRRHSFYSISNWESQVNHLRMEALST